MSLIGGMLASHCRDDIGVELRAPVAILSALFWITSRLLMLVSLVVIRAGVLYIILLLIAAQYRFSKDFLSAPYLL